MQEIERPLNSIQVGEFLTPSALWLIFALVLGVFAIISAILLYHWHKYTFDEKAAKKAMVLYFLVSGIFVLLLVVSLLSLTL
jgi:cytochrome bd-type quinol oxidase subunit 2